MYVIYLQLVKITNPLNKEIDDELLDVICEKAKETSNGGHITLQFLAHKVQSPQEIEAVHALNVRKLMWIV